MLLPFGLNQVFIHNHQILEKKTKKNEMKYAHVKDIVYCIHLFIFPKNKKVCNKMRVLHLSRSLKIMVLYKNEGVAP
jgi:hypothetical protein